MNVKLINACKQSGLKDWEIAGQAKISCTHFSLIKHGFRDPSKKLARTISKILNGTVSEMELLYPNDPPAAADQPKNPETSANGAVNTQEGI